MRILITGGCGFIGTNLVNRLLKQKDNISKDNINIIIIDNLWRGNKKYIENKDNVKIIEEDLVNYDICLKYIKDVDIVYHLAEIVSGVNFATNNQAFIYRKNILINSNVLNSCIENKIKNYVYVSSACVYPRDKQNVKSFNYFREEDINPISPETS